MPKASQRKGANMMIKITAFSAMLTLLAPLGAFADALNPNPLSVLQAAYATIKLGNVDAAMCFFTSDAELWNSRGQKMDGLEGIRRWNESNVKANISVCYRNG